MWIATNKIAIMTAKPHCERYLKKSYTQMKNKGRIKTVLKPHIESHCNPSSRELRHEDHKFEANLGYKVKQCPKNKIN
jgi:hypothetical protein